MRYARIIAGLVVAIAEGDGYSSIDDSVKSLWTSVPADVDINWRKVNGVWTPPPQTPEPAPQAYYISKVTFERRFDNEAFAALDGLRITIRNRPADWSATDVDPWPDLRPYVRPLCDYDASDRINVLDPAIGDLLRGLQSQRQLFGVDETAAEANIAAILTPAQLSGEPTP